MPITERLATDTGIAGDLITSDPSLTGTAAPNVLLTLTEGGLVLGAATADGSGIWSFRPTGLADGAHTIVVGNDLDIAIQGAGYFQIQLPDGEIAYTRDGAFALSATGQIVTADGNVVQPGITIPNGALAVTIEDTGAVQVLLAGQSTPILVGNIELAAFANEAGLLPLVGGLFQASAASGAPVTGTPGSSGFGVISQADTASLSFTLDTAAPQPANHLAHDTGVSTTDTVTSDATLTGLASPNQTLLFTEGASILGTATADASGAWTFLPPNLADGTHVITAGDSQDLDLTVQGNGYFQIQLPTGEIAYTRDGSFSLSPTGQLVTADGNVVQPGITIPPDATAIAIDSQGVVQVLLGGNPQTVGSIQLAIFANQAGLAPLGGGLFQASAASGAPEIGSPGSSGFGSIIQLGTSDVGFTLDTTPPGVPIILGLAAGSDSGIDGDGITNVAQPTLAGVADAGSTIVLYADGVQVGAAIADPVSGAWSITASTLGDGAHLLTATSADPAGNTSTASAPLAVTIDTGVPPVSLALAVDTGGSASDGITTDATLIGSGDPDAIVTLSEGGITLATTIADGTGAWVFTPLLPDGPHTIVASETDAAGNTSLASAALDFTVDTSAPSAPTITSVIDDVPAGLGPLADGASTNDTDLTLNVNLTGVDAVAGDTIQLYNGTDTTNPLGIHTLTSADITSGSADIQTGTLASTGTFDLTARVIDQAGNTSGASSTFTVVEDPSAVCFASGTHLLTSTGEVLVEALLPGVLMVKNDGSEVPVKWIGRRRVDLTAHPRPETVAPIRIQRGAFADNMPHSDLVVSPDHAIFVDGKLICARQLINGTTIRQEKDRTAVEYFHVELDTHAILLAEGLPAESYLNTGNQGFFANSGQPLVLHPDLTDETAYPTRETASCAPFVWDEGNVRPVWQRLADRATALGQPTPKLETATDTDLHIVAKGRAVQPLYSENGLYIFVLPKGATEVRVVSRAGSPADARPWWEDRRCLGVCVERIVLRDANGGQDVPVDHPGLSQGWWAVEQDGTALVRWTDGNAVLPLPATHGPAMLEIRANSGGMVYVTGVNQGRRVA